MKGWNMVSADPATARTSADSTEKALLTARLTAPGGPFALAEEEVRGIPMRVYAEGPQTLRDVVLSTAGYGQRTFLVYEDRRWTFAEHLRLVLGLARCLREEYGLAKGERVAVSMRNYPEWSPVLFAAAVAGLVVVPLNAWWTAPELRYALDDSGAKLLVADAERIAVLAGQRAELGIPMIEVRGGDPAPGVRSWDDVLAGLDPDATAPEVDIHPDDDATILYTSGTTGRPKGAVGSHRNHCTNLMNTLLGGFVSATIANGGVPPTPDPDAPQPGALNTFPLFHIAGLTGLLYTLAAGAKHASQYRWDAEQAIELVAREQLTGVSGVPTVVRQLVEAATGDPSRIASLAGLSMGGTPVPPDLIGHIDSGFASLVAPANGYGLTETTSAVVSNSGADYVARPDSVGRCVPGADVRVVDPATGDDVADGAVGELWFRGPNVVRGYWNDPEATAAAFTDGWFHTGDLGAVRDGWVYVVDRLKDVVIRGGENIYCAEVEAALFEHPAVGDVAIVGVPHESLGEEAVAVVQLRPGAVASTADLQAHVRERLAAFKVPAYVVFRDGPLPRTPSGKVLKRDLRGDVAAELRTR
ncbi:class I adenylate-forming enzyme family protein [Pseudonocardia humida]|uniref:Acyl--CoA ligase n=1 Tax=Pseudonocardia humida TaxID=2800819 RepID=A0ABT0ZZT3_9PSEU|nr:class I adenylate-forming enzyme family protein [Pseudonocardia humida]MCO1656193.1 acyl--CoA ligase [Pseudonocardia humida]